jgi:hypothetical protein
MAAASLSDTGGDAREPKEALMDPIEEEQPTFCAECDSEVNVTDRVYAFGTDDVLCFECAIKRHGVYDERLDRWTVAPKVDDLMRRFAREA